jgi:hypothetical protein
MKGGTERAEFEVNETSDIVSFKMYDVVEELKYLKTPTEKLIYTNVVDVYYNDNIALKMYLDLIKKFLNQQDPIQKDIYDIIQHNEYPQKILYIGGFYNSFDKYPEGALVKKNDIEKLFNPHDFTKKIVGDSDSSNGEDGTYRDVGDLDLTKTEGFGYVNLKCIITKMKSLLPELKYVFLNPAGNYKKKWLVEHYKKLGFISMVCSPDISYPKEMPVCDDKGGRGDLMMFADYEILKSNLETKVSSGKHNMSRCDNIRRTGGKKKKTKRRNSKRRNSKRRI